MKLKVNPRLVPIKAHFFLSFAALSAVVPFMPVFARQLGIDEISSSVVFATLPFMGMLAKPLAGWISDRFGLEKVVFMASICTTGVFYFALILVGNIQADTSSVFKCSSPYSMLEICRGEEQTKQLIRSLATSCPVECTLVCSMEDETEMKSICAAFDYRIKGCFNDTTPLDVRQIEFTTISNLTRHDTQPRPECLILPIDALKIPKMEEKLEDDHLLDGVDVVDSVLCSFNTEISCQTTCRGDNLQGYIRKDNVLRSGNFWMFFILMIIAYSAFNVVASMGDALCFNILEGKHGDYGVQRVFGSFGWGLTTVLAGYLVDIYSKDLNGAKDYTPALFLMAGLLFLDLICAWRMRIIPTAKSADGGTQVLRLLKTPQIIVFVVWCLIVGILTSIIWQWLPWFLWDLADTLAETESCNKVDHTTWLTLLLSLVMGIQCFAGEVPMFFLSGWVLKKLGHINTMTMVLAAFGLRFLLYSFLTDPWMSLPIEVLNGITFGIFYATMASYAHIIAPPGMEATMQGVVGAAFEGAGVAIGSLVGGAVYKAKGGVFMFRAFGIFSLACCLLHFVFQLTLGKSNAANRSGATVSDAKTATEFNRITATEDIEKPIFKGNIGSGDDEHNQNLLEGSVL